jgi:exodeoxyribonuclease-5
MDIVIPDTGYINGIAQEERITQLSEDQEKALDLVDEFMKSNKKHMVIGGVAGSGKSSIIPYIINKYNTSKKWFEDINEVECCAYTGKAVMVLKRKGVVAAKTLHSFLYHSQISKNEETGEPIVVYKEKHDDYFYGVKLLIVDESSMMTQDMFNLINRKSFKTLYIGDHFQLPPVKDDFNIMLKPDFKMERVLRQNEDNPIIQLAEMARNGKSIPLGTYGTSKHTLKFNKEELLNYDNIVVWTNKTKDYINELIREQMGFPANIPQINEKMIVKVNCQAKNIFNGQIVYLMNQPKKNKKGGWEVEFVDELAYNDPFVMAQTNQCTKAIASIHLSKEELDRIRTTPKKWKQYKIPNTEFVKFVPDEEMTPYQIHLDWGYAITCHQAQGSSWSNVAIMLDKKMKYIVKDGYNRWLYTAITRAEDSVTIYSGDF